MIVRALVWLLVACVASAGTETSEIDQKTYHIFDCTPDQQRQIAKAIDEARLMAQPAVNLLAHESVPLPKAFEVMFGTTMFLRRTVLKYLRNVPSLDPNPLRASYKASKSNPEFFCANSNGPQRSGFRHKTATQMCEESPNETIALQLSDSTVIILCDHFWALEPDYGAQDYCPRISRINEWGPGADRLTGIRPLTILHELIHFYLPCGGQDFVARMVAKMNNVKKEVYGLEDCVKYPEDLRIRNPDNYINYVALIFQNCTKLVNPYRWPFERYRPRLGLNEGSSRDEMANGTTPHNTLGMDMTGTIHCAGGGVIRDPPVPLVQTANASRGRDDSLKASSTPSIIEVV